jgi:hypothetical protein
LAKLNDNETAQKENGGLYPTATDSQALGQESFCFPKEENEYKTFKAQNLEAWRQKQSNIREKAPKKNDYRHGSFCTSL